MSWENESSKQAPAVPIPRHSASRCWTNSVLGKPVTENYDDPILCTEPGTNMFKVVILFPYWNPNHAQHCNVDKAYITVYNTRVHTHRPTDTGTAFKHQKLYHENPFMLELNAHIFTFVVLQRILVSQGNKRYSLVQISTSWRCHRPGRLLHYYSGMKLLVLSLSVRTDE